MKLLLLITAIIFVYSIACSQSVQLNPMYHSIGVKVSLPNGYDIDETSHCYIKYKKTAESIWSESFDADRVLVQNNSQFRGSIFLTEEGTSYDVEVTIVDSVPTITSQVIPVQSITTLRMATLLPITNVQWVSPNGSGTVYTQTQPGNIKVLLSSGSITCGSTIMIMDGLYKDIDMSLTITTECTESNPILFLAAPGAHPVFDGGYSTALTWTQHATDSKLYSAALPQGADYTNLCLLNGQYLYPYATVTANALFGNYNLVDLNLDDDGFVRDNTVIWIKTKAGVNPNASSVVMSKAFRFLTVYGNNKNSFLTFKGLTVKNITKSIITGTTSYGAIAFDIRNTNHVTFDNCVLEYNNSNLNFNGQCNNLLIQNCRVLHGNGFWSHAMTKKSNIEFVLVPTSMGRGGETGAVKLYTNTNVVVRYNRFEGINSGVVSDFDTGLIEESDIYNNVFANNFDAIECDGNWCNLRVWKNEIISPMAGFSIAPPMIGPRYFYRNVVHHLKGRHNKEDDPYFTQCSPVLGFNSQAIGIKTNFGDGAPTVNPSNLYFFNNTFHSDDTLGFAYTLWRGEWKNIYVRNNIFYSTKTYVGYFQGFLNQSTFQMNSANDNYYCSDTTKPIFVIKEIHGQYTCHEVYDVHQIENRLRAITGGNKISFVQPSHVKPNFSSTESGGFDLLPTSGLINKGEIIKGFYDYIGVKPDLGAKESEVSNTSAEEVENNNIRIYPNPSNSVVYINAGNTTGTAEINVVNYLGQTIATYTHYSPNILSIPLPEPSGLYCIHIVINNTSYNKFVIKL